VNDLTKTAEELYSRYRGDVYRLVYMMTGNLAISEDVTQDVFLEALQKSDTIHTSPRAWLLAAARNKTLNLMKREKWSVPLTQDLSHTDRSDLQFLDMLRPLNARQREVVICHVLYGLPHTDTAKVLRVSHAAVRKQYERALTILRGTVKKGG
jgi:RNA polymerase sigma-70 factor (ECF subfamily)